MKKIHLIIVLLTMASPLMGQKSNQLNDMIVESLRSYSDYSSELYKKMWGDYGSYNKYVCKDGLPLGFPYDSLPNFIFFSTNSIQENPNPFKKDLKKGTSAYFVYFELKNNRIRISVVGKIVKLVNKKTIGTASAESGHYFYEYSCETQQWELKETDLGLKKKAPKITPNENP